MRERLLKLREAVYGDSSDWVYVDSTTWPHKGLFSPKIGIKPLWNPFQNSEHALQMHGTVFAFVEHECEFTATLDAAPVIEENGIWIAKAIVTIEEIPAMMYVEGTGSTATEAYAFMVTRSVECLLEAIENKLVYKNMKP